MSALALLRRGAPKTDGDNARRGDIISPNIRFIAAAKICNKDANECLKNLISVTKPSMKRVSPNRIHDIIT